MASRMQRYYKGEERSKKNQSLYDEISANGNYTNIEGMVDISNSNEINIDNIKELIDGSYNTKHSKPVERIEKKKTRVEKKAQEETEKNYDIMDVLNKAKNSHNEKDLKYRNLKKKQIKILRELKDEHPEDEKIDELMNTLALGNSISDDLGMFDDLKSNTMVGEEASAIKKVLDEAKDNIETEDVNVTKEKNEEQELDTSFYTSSFIISDESFEDLKNLDKNLKKNNKLIKILIIIFSCLLAIILLFVIAKIIF